MIEAVGENTHKDPFAGELGHLGQIQLQCFAERGAAADILVSGIDEDVGIFDQFQQFLMFFFVTDPETGIVVDPGGLQRNGNEWR